MRLDVDGVDDRFKRSRESFFKKNDIHLEITPHTQKTIYGGTHPEFKKKTNNKK